MDVEVRRTAVIDATIRTYEGYVGSGHAARWVSLEAGMQTAIGQRDAWVIRATTPALDGLVIDLGCGDGALGVLLDRAGRHPARYVGVDILEPRLSVARERVPWGEILKASADKLPVTDGTASAVVAMTLFSSLTDRWFRRRVAHEIGRVLRPGGRLVVYDLRYPSPRNPHVRPVSKRLLRSMFPGWTLESQTMTLMPPLARSWLAADARGYRLLERIPLLRSHLGAILIKPG